VARVKPLDPSEVPELAHLLEARRRGLGFLPNSALTIARWPELAEAYGKLADAIASTRKLSPGLSSLIFLVASNAAGCEYCVAHGASKAITKGVLESKLEGVWEFENSPLFDAAERSALRLALAAGVTPSAVTDEHFDELRLHFDDDAIVEIVGVIAFSGFMNRWNATMGTTLEEQPRSVAERLLAVRGWTIGPHDQ